jgi:hypothetical protein
LLLHPNEAILKVGVRQDWRSGFGSKNTRLAGKELYIPNPLNPGAAVFRLSWHDETLFPSYQAGWESRLGALRRFQVPVWWLFFLSFLVLPTVLFGHFGDALLLMVFSLIYLTVVLIAVLLYLDKETFAFSRREFWLAAFDLLICPPFAINVIRRLSLRWPIEEDFAAAASRLQTAARWRETESELRNRLIDEVYGEDEGSPRSKALKERIALLTPKESDDKS